eukprot:jgi/Ulvmu1/2967/UM015_0007.1
MSPASAAQPHEWAGAAGATSQVNPAESEGPYSRDAYFRVQPSQAGGGTAPGLWPWPEHGGAHDEFGWHVDASGSPGGPTPPMPDGGQDVMMMRGHHSAHPGHLGQHYVDVSRSNHHALPPHLSAGPRHHSMPDRRPMDDSASGLMQAAHELMMGSDCPVWPRMPAMRSITLPTGHYNAPPPPWDSPPPPPHTQDPRRIAYLSGAPNSGHQSMHHRMQQYSHTSQWHPSQEYALGLSPGAHPVPLSAPPEGAATHTPAAGPVAHSTSHTSRGPRLSSTSSGIGPAGAAHAANLPWPQQHPKASNMSSLRRLLESSSDSKEEVAAALQHTTGGFVPGLPGLTKLVSLFTKQGKWRKALAIYDVLDCLGLQPDLVICNAALGACARGADTSRLWQLLNDLLEKGRVPDSITFKGAISALSKNGEWQQSLKLFLSMCEQGKVAEGATCLALIGTCAKARQWQLAEEVFLCTIARDLDIRFVDAVGAPDTGAMAEADLALLHRLQACRHGGGGVRPLGATPPDAADDQVQQLAAGELAAAADTDHARDAGSDAQAPGPSQPAPAPGAPPAGPSPPKEGADSIHDLEKERSTDAAVAWSVAAGVQAALDSATVAGATPAARSGPLVEWQTHSPLLYNGHTETEYLFARTCCNALLIAYKIAEPVQCQRALALLTAITQIGGIVSPDVISYNSVMEAMGTAGRVRDALSLLPVLRAADLQPSRTTMTLLMSLASSAGLPGEVVALWADLLRSGLRPETRALNLYLSALISLGRWNEACEQYQALLRQAHSPAPDSETFSIMLWACLDQGDPMSALRIVQDAASLSKPMRVAALQRLVALLQGCGMQDAASALQCVVAR